MVAKIILCTKDQEFTLHWPCLISHFSKTPMVCDLSRVRGHNDGHEPLSEHSEVRLTWSMERVTRHVTRTQCRENKNATKHHKHEICIYHRPLTIKRLPQNSFKIKPSQHKTIGVPNDIQHIMLVTSSIVCLKLNFINKKVQFFSQYCHTAILVLNRSGIMRFNSWNLEQGVPCHYNSYNYQTDWQQVPTFIRFLHRTIKLSGCMWGIMGPGIPVSNKFVKCHHPSSW